MTTPQPTVQPVPGLPPWAPPGATWDQLIGLMRFWLKPGDEMFTDEQLQFLMLAAPSFAAAVVVAWNTKIRWYADPNRVTQASIGSESMTWPSAKDLIASAKESLKDVKKALGLSTGGSRVLALDEYRQVFGVTPYHASPPPYVVPSTWPNGSIGFDLSRSGGGGNDFFPGTPPPLLPTPHAPAPADEPATPRPPVRPKRT